MLSAFAAIPGPIVAVALLEEGINVNTQVEIDLGLARVSDGVLTMLEGANGVANLPPGLFSNLLDALAEEHLPGSVPAQGRRPCSVCQRDRLTPTNSGTRYDCWATGLAAPMRRRMAIRIWKP